MLFIGNFLVIFGLFMLSLSTKYYQVFLAQAVCIGLGAGLLYIPSLALIGLSFSTKRSLAQGITTSGIAVGMYPRFCTKREVFGGLRIGRSDALIDVLTSI
jgi:MFS family permease